MANGDLYDARIRAQQALDEALPTGCRVLLYHESGRFSDAYLGFRCGRVFCSDARFRAGDRPNLYEYLFQPFGGGRPWRAWATGLRRDGDNRRFRVLGSSGRPTGWRATLVPLATEIEPDGSGWFDRLFPDGMEET